MIGCLPTDLRNETLRAVDPALTIRFRYLVPGGTEERCSQFKSDGAKFDVAEGLKFGGNSSCFGDQPKQLSTDCVVDVRTRSNQFFRAVQAFQECRELVTADLGAVIDALEVVRQRANQSHVPDVDGTRGLVHAVPPRDGEGEYSLVKGGYYVTVVLDILANSVHSVQSDFDLTDEANCSRLLVPKLKAVRVAVVSYVFGWVALWDGPASQQLVKQSCGIRHEARSYGMVLFYRTRRSEIGGTR